jgi:tetratricopeptide (TPR) repeat protein
VGVAVVCALLAIFLALNGRDASLVRDANDAGRAGRFDEVVSTADRVHRAPADLRALVAKARAHTGAGRLGQADAAWAAVARRDPNNWEVHYEWARALIFLGGDREKAAAIYDRARELNPQLPEF